MSQRLNYFPGVAHRIALAFLIFALLAGTTGIVISQPATAAAPPVFSDGATTTRSVSENTASGENVGDPIAASDADGDTLTYELSGTDAASFGIVSATGQITVGAGTTLNRETQDSYSIDTAATDPSGASTTIAVTIVVTEVDYDANKDGAIDRDEVLAAVVDYFASRITKDEVMAVIVRYFSVEARATRATQIFDAGTGYNVLTRYGSTTEIELSDYLAAGATGITFTLTSCESSRADYYDSAAVENGKLILTSNTLGHVHGQNTESETVCTITGTGENLREDHEFRLYTVSGRTPPALLSGALSLVTARPNEVDIRISVPSNSLGYLRRRLRHRGQHRPRRLRHAHADRQRRR